MSFFTFFKKNAKIPSKEGLKSKSEHDSNIFKALTVMSKNAEIMTATCGFILTNGPLHAHLNWGRFTVMTSHCRYSGILAHMAVCYT